jgi:hypothetical protein
MDGEQEAEGGELVVRARPCPACKAEDAQLIEFATGQVFRCDRCGLLELTRTGEPPAAGA